MHFQTGKFLTQKFCEFRRPLKRLEVVTGVKKLTGVCEAFGVKCEVHMSGFANLQILGSTSEDVCEYYERGLHAPGDDYETPPPYLHALGDPLNADGYVHLSQEPGMGYQINWDYIEEHRV